MKKVAVIGAGYGGLRAVEHLCKNVDFDIYLFDKERYHYLQTEAYGYIAGRFDLGDVALDLKNWCYGFDNSINFIQEEVVSISSEQNMIQTDKGSYHFDYLIIATGAHTNFFSFISGLREYSYGVKNLQKSYKFRRDFEEILYQKLSSNDDVINLVIGGAGLSGVEIAAEMAYVIKRDTKSIGESIKKINIYLVDAKDNILDGMDSYIIKNTKKRLEELDVKIMTSSFIKNVTKDKIYFKDDQELPYTFLIFTGGIVSNFISLDFEPKTNQIKQYITDDTLRIKENIFAIGDCCELRGVDGKILPPTAQSAESSAEYVVKSIEDLTKDKQPQEYKDKLDGIFVALGGNYAVGELFGKIYIKGYLAYLLKKLITKSYYIGLKLRINTGFKKRNKSNVLK